MWRLREKEVTGVWRKLSNYNCYDLYSSPFRIMVIKARRVRYRGPAVCKGK
jgi:hypothetical protein